MEGQSITTHSRGRKGNPSLLMAGMEGPLTAGMERRSITTHGRGWKDNQWYNVNFICNSLLKNKQTMHSYYQSFVRKSHMMLDDHVSCSSYSCDQPNKWFVFWYKGRALKGQTVMQQSVNGAMKSHLKSTCTSVFNFLCGTKRNINILPAQMEACSTACQTLITTMLLLPSTP